MPELIVFANNQEVLYFKDCRLRIDAKQFEISTLDEGELNFGASFFLNIFIFLALEICITQVNQKFCRKIVSLIKLFLNLKIHVSFTIFGKYFRIFYSPSLPKQKASHSSFTMPMSVFPFMNPSKRCK